MAAQQIRKPLPASLSRLRRELAHRWLRRRGAEPWEWAVVMDPKTGETQARYVRRPDGRVERAE